MGDMLLPGACCCAPTTCDGKVSCGDFSDLIPCCFKGQNVPGAWNLSTWRGFGGTPLPCDDSEDTEEGPVCYTNTYYAGFKHPNGYFISYPNAPSTEYWNFDLPDADQVSDPIIGWSFPPSTFGGSGLFQIFDQPRGDPPLCDYAGIRLCPTWSYAGSGIFANWQGWAEYHPGVIQVGFFGCPEVNGPKFQEMLNRGNVTSNADPLEALWPCCTPPHPDTGFQKCKTQGSVDLLDGSCQCFVNQIPEFPYCPDIVYACGKGCDCETIPNDDPPPRAYPCGASCIATKRNVGTVIGERQRAILRSPRTICCGTADGTSDTCSFTLQHEIVYKCAGATFPTGDGSTTNELAVFFSVSGVVAEYNDCPRTVLAPYYDEDCGVAYWSGSNPLRRSTVYDIQQSRCGCFTECDYNSHKVVKPRATKDPDTHPICSATNRGTCYNNSYSCSYCPCDCDNGEVSPCPDHWCNSALIPDACANYLTFSIS